jgi:2-dehydro-3-deoxyphosphogluconate aldolase/(4S)-4-hydroxy-2-oxoglutarate aldolase
MNALSAMSALRVLDDVRLVPVVNIEKLETAVPLAEAFLSAGIRAIEVTLRTSCGLAAIEAIRANVPDIIVGAGSVRQIDHVRQVLDAGAQFGVSPGSPATLLDEVENLGLAFVPGAATATEVMTLVARGYELVKFFPAERLGGLQTLSAIAAPLPEVRFFPTGGVNAENVLAYLRHASVVCVGGSWFVPSNLLEAGDYIALQALASEANAICAQS